MKYILFVIVLLLSQSTYCQKLAPNINGTWKALSKIETETIAGTVTGEDKEIYKDGENTYTFTATSVSISQGFGKHKEKLPIRLQGDRLFIGKFNRNKQPYVLSVNGSQLILTKTEHKEKKGKTQTEVEVVTLEK